MSVEAKRPDATKIELFDTSLRDGMQQPNLEISVANAVGLLQRMGAFGVKARRSGLQGPINLSMILTTGVARGDQWRDGSFFSAYGAQTCGFCRNPRRGCAAEDWPGRPVHSAAQRGMTAVVVVKARLLDVAKSLETTADMNLG